MVKHDHKAWLVRSLSALNRPISVQLFSEWCAEHLRVPAIESESGGPFSFSSREYSIDPINDYGDDTVEELTLAWGSQTGKTMAIMGGTAARIANRPCRAMWVLPTRDIAREFCETRWTAIVEASETLRKMKSVDRHKFTKSKQHIGNSMIVFRGSNSPANLASMPANLVNLDEVDKFSEGTSKEANAVDLAEQRTKSFSRSFKMRCSTPTIATSLIWEKFELGTQHRYFVPCFSCKRHILLIWDKEKSVMKPQGCEAQVKWDQEAKRKDGTWDKDRVTRSARFECPHCGFHIQDQHKTWMMRGGEWRATNPFAKSTARSRHLPSLYSCSRQMRIGQLCVRWLELLETGRGVQAMVNGELAEPYEGQESKVKRFEIIVRSGSEKVEGAIRFMTVDVQLVAPYFWALTRDWSVDGHSVLDQWKALNSWDDVRAFQIDRGVEDFRVFIDCRHRPAEVFDNCLKWGNLASRGGIVRTHIGWTPTEGHGRDRIFRDPKTKLPRLFELGKAQLPHSRFELPKLLFNGPQLKDILANIRKPNAKIRWAVNEFADITYWEHMDCEIKKPFRHPRTKRIFYDWAKRSERTPNHLYDDEINQFAVSMLNRRFPWALHSELQKAQNEQASKPEGTG